ncbi:MAG: PAS domain S-box protein [Candidatus Omnitrophota bacterium]
MKTKKAPLLPKKKRFKRISPALPRVKKTIHSSDKQTKNNDSVSVSPLELSPLPYQSLNSEGCLIQVNQAWLDVMQYSGKEVIGHRVGDFLAVDSKKLFQERFPLFKAGGLAGGVELEMKRKDGTCFTASLNGTISYDLEGRFKQAHCIFIDVTARKKAVLELKESEERFKCIFDAVNDGILLADIETREFRLGNRAICKMLGYDLDALRGLAVNDIHPEEELPKVREVFKQQCEGKINLAQNIPLKKKDGTVFYVDINASIMVMNGRKYLMGVFRDITERTQAEAALLASESRYRSIVENTNDALYIHDFEGTIMDVNENACKMTGYSRDDLMGASLAKIDCPENTRLMQKHMQRLLRDGKVEFDGQHMKKDHSCVWVTVSAKIVSRSGKGIVQGFVKDITERKCAEERIKAALVEKELLLRELNHRVKNNLQVVNSLLNLQARKIKDEGVREILMESHSRIKSIAMVHEKLYGSSDFSRIDMKEYLNSLLRSIAHSFDVTEGTVSLKVVADDGIWFNMDMVVHCGLIVNELVTNAFKYAFPDNRKGEICVELKAGENNTYELVVRDNGVGLPKDFDLKSSQTLGLELVNILARQLGEVKLLRTGGTAFKVTLNKG